MTARSIKRRNAKRMTVYMRLTLWRICGGPSERIPGALLDMQLEGDERDPA